MNEEIRKINTREKALKINLDERIYGSFAEIGAGQEVAANFFKAGASSGTIAKTMSAYDMTFSDAIYGKTKRYVCEERLLQMLNKEYKLLQIRLHHRHESTCYFSYANTIEALNFNKTNQGHGWMGVRFQLKPNSPPNECIIHFQMKDNDTLRQQNAVGIVGVNLMFAVFYLYQQPEVMLNSLVDGLQEGRVEVDFFRISGPDFSEVDNRLMSLKLVKNGLTKATMFAADGSVLQPAEALYKKNVLALRARFRPVTKVNLDMLQAGLKQFQATLPVAGQDLVVLCELTLKNLSDKGKIDYQDFLDRVDILCSLGFTVMISNYEEYYKLSRFLTQVNKGRRLGIIIGMDRIRQIFDETFYTALPSGLLEGIAHLFSENVTVLAYPFLHDQTDHLETVHNIEVSESKKLLIEYLSQQGKIQDLTEYDRHVLSIRSEEVVQMIITGKDGWESLVPESVVKTVKENCLFNYPCDPYKLLKLRSGKRGKN